MVKTDLHVEEARSQKDLMTFIRFPWRIYQGNPHWVPPLIKDQLYKFGPDHPFRSHSKMTLFLAYREGEVVGRIAGIIDHNFIEYQQEVTGFFGFFESIDDPQVAQPLLSRVKDWLRAHGMKKMIGPMNPSINDECGLLIDGFHFPPCLMMPYNPPYYETLLEMAALKKAKDLYAYLLERSTFVASRLNRIATKLTKKEPDLRLRHIDLRHLDEELKIIKEIYNHAWSRNWGFVPLTEAEIDDLAKHLKPLVVPDLVLFAYWKDEPVGFSVSLPDYNRVLKRLNGRLGLIGFFKYLYLSKKIDTLRVMLLGVKHAFQKRGIEAFLYYETFKRGIEKGYVSAECSWILEDNLLMQRGIEAMGGSRYKTYRIYEASL